MTTRYILLLCLIVFQSWDNFFKIIHDHEIKTGFQHFHINTSTRVALRIWRKLSFAADGARGSIDTGMCLSLHQQVCMQSF